MMKLSYNKSNITEDFFRTKINSMFNDIRDYSRPRYCSGESETETQFKQKKKTNSSPKMADGSKYSAGQLVYVKKYNSRSGKFQICDGEIVSSVDKGFGAISYTWVAVNTRKSYRAWEDEIYPSYSSARDALDTDEVQKKKAKKEETLPKVTYGNSQDIKSIRGDISDISPGDISVVSASPETGTIMLKSSNGIERDACYVVDSIDTTKDDIIATNSRCSDIEQRVNYLEKELTKEKKKRSKLVRLGIACLFGR